MSRISVLPDRVDIAIRPGRLASWVLDAPTPETDDHDADTIISAPVRVQQRGQEMRLVFGNEQEVPPGHAALVRLLRRAHAMKRRLCDDRLTIDEAAEAEGLVPSYATRLVRVAFLAPDIVGIILSGRHHPDLTATRLMADTRLPLDWAEQRRLLASSQ